MESAVIIWQRSRKTLAYIRPEDGRIDVLRPVCALVTAASGFSYLRGEQLNKRGVERKPRSTKKSESNGFQAFGRIRSFVCSSSDRWIGPITEIPPSVAFLLIREYGKVEVFWRERERESMLTDFGALL